MHQHLWNDSSSFHPVHPLIRAFGPKVLHHAKGHCQDGKHVIYEYGPRDHAMMALAGDLVNLASEVAQKGGS